jgi:WXG100 family type VII secretion target
MAEQIRMNFGMMEEMAQAFGDGAQTLESTLSEVNNIAKMLEDGGLLGEAGDAFASACRGSLAGSISRLQKTFEDMRNDVIAAKEEMESADSSSKGYYS